MEQHTLISLVLPYDYGHLGGGKSRAPKDYTDEENTEFLESIKVQDIEVVEANVVEEEPVEVPPAPETPIQLDVPPAPDFGDLE